VVLFTPEEPLQTVYVVLLLFFILERRERGRGKERGGNRIMCIAFADYSSHHTLKLFLSLLSINIITVKISN